MKRLSSTQHELLAELAEPGAKLHRYPNGRGNGASYRVTAAGWGRNIRAGTAEALIEGGYLSASETRNFVAVPNTIAEPGREYLATYPHPLAGKHKDLPPAATAGKKPHVDSEMIKRVAGLVDDLDNSLGRLSGWFDGHCQWARKAAEHPTGGDHVNCATNAAKHAEGLREEADKITAMAGDLIAAAAALAREAKAAALAAQRQNQ